MDEEKEANASSEEDLANIDDFQDKVAKEIDYNTVEVELNPEDTLERLMDLVAMVYVRDADPCYLRAQGDPVPEDISYDELGRVILDFRKIISSARYANGALVMHCIGTDS
tara:strand:- start:67 stop:399 length:333 start_codon:yes stop_codon:yes gene_type:complete